MYSEPIARSTLVQNLAGDVESPPDSQTVRNYIREQKAGGRLIERRVFVDPAKSRKRRQVFQFVAVNLELEF
jgi:hypothetical protein